MIDAAKQAGVDAVKFQTFQAAKLYTRKAKGYKYVKTKETIYSIVKRYEMPLSWISELNSYCKRRRIIFFSTAADEQSADRLERHVPAYKLASYSITHIPLIKYIARKGKPIIFSTGCANIGDIELAIQAMRSQGNNKIAMMHCVGKYPASLDSVNLGVIPPLKQLFGIPVGFSDHTEDPVKAPTTAVKLGADLIEKHFTLDKTMDGPDHAFAVNPKGLKLMVQAIRKTEKRMKDGEKVKVDKRLVGSSIKRTLDEEEYLRDYAYRTIFAARDMKKGDVLTKRNMVVLRPGGTQRGLEPKYYEMLTKKRVRLTKPVKAGDAITWDHILVR
jgi:sialic acid synthase SpsE